MANYDYDDIATSEEDFPFPLDTQTSQSTSTAAKPLDSSSEPHSTLGSIWQNRPWAHTEPGKPKQQPNWLSWRKEDSPSKVMSPGPGHESIPAAARASFERSRKNSSTAKERRESDVSLHGNKRRSSSIKSSDSEVERPAQLVNPFRRSSGLDEPPNQTRAHGSEYTKDQNKVDEFFADRIERWSGTE